MPTNDTTSDELLALRLQWGDSGAMDELVQRYYVAIRRYLYRLTRYQDALSEELTQETMFHLIQGIGSYNAARPFRPWLYTIATNLFRNYRKRAEQRFRQGSDEATEAIIANLPDEREPSMEEAWQAEETTKRISKELNRLPEMQQQIIILRYYQELTLAEIAEMLNVPLGTVKSRLRLGLERLRKILEVEEG